MAEQVTADPQLEPLHPPRLRTAHDVRFLRVCVHCKDLGDSRHMLRTGKHYWHGRCYIKQNGLQALIDQGLEFTGHLTLNDIGTDAMQALLERS